MSIHISLQNIFSFSRFRNGQEQCIDQLINGQSSLAVFPTGSGKSLCYQLTAMHLPHLTLVVSPLLALIKDQLDFLKKVGIPAASIDSTLSFEEQQQVSADVRSGKVKVLMVSVERFKNERFRRFIQSVQLSMLVVDEAHCISEWGHNFRPDYLKLPQYRQELNIPLVLLLTATATRKVKRDMAEKFDIKPEHVIQTGFYRANLNLHVVPVTSQQKNQSIVKQIHQQQGSGIVYVMLQHTAEMVAEALRGQGINAEAYHAGFDNDNRQQIQNRFMTGQVQVIVATIAFGMGIDKSDIRFVIHYDLPKSIENYSQEIGRAGRDGHSSNCITLANLDGLNTLENFVYGDTPEQQGIESVLEDIRNSGANGQWEVQINSISNQSNVRQLPLKTLLVQLEMMGIIQPLFSYFAEYKFKYLQSNEFILSQFEGERQQFISYVFQHSAMKKVWGEFNLEQLQEGYGCDRNRLVSALDYLHEKQWIELQSKNMTEVYRVDTTLLAQLDLAARLYDYFKDKEQKEISRIASLVRFFELETCLSNNLARYFDDQDVPAQCGHCSVCQGTVAKLAYSFEGNWPADEAIASYLQSLDSHISLKQGAAARLSVDSKTRFLTGISVPLFARNRVKGLPGYGCCEKLRYAEVLRKVQSLNL
ncbi:MAG: ATP-dependent DNA helicase RecQ [Flavobacteriales bacterium]|jgi:ATP-dependent DNA helicase RecQ